ncbi:hypothetical protein H6F86_13940 [Phormidium sp. FACHB-592]|uniref:Uncharacterized protein n=1 Tax=Stenomitos frigidus AS-A4 TaxID=2933935 RepID=A0ABV0KQC4_9CYAN|nr:hypothetical protein [Phormidium sp. FACHB-592]MBD2074975.1 hypothetical protein [Phormidium sp. FACHB-592]
MNCRLWSLAVSVGLALMTLIALRAHALPPESDSACYMTTASGQVIDLKQSLCRTQPASRLTQTRSSYRRPASSHSHTGVRSVVKRVNGGVTTTVYASPGYNATMRSVYAGYNSSYNSGRRTQTSSSSGY